MASPSPFELAFRYVDAINARNIAQLEGLISEDHLFIDSLGQSVSGREAMIEGWSRYFELFPAYHIAVAGHASEGAMVLLHGHAEGTTLSGERWRIPAAWRAEIRNDEVALWQVYADNSVVERLLRGA